MAGHGAPPRGLESTAQSSIGVAKFGRMFRWLEPAIAPQGPTQEAEVHDLLRTLAALMVTSEFNENLEGGKPTPDSPIEESEPDDENPNIPAGYTYFGQFIDHDITFDPTSTLQRLNDPDALEDFRTPRLDLDSLYGRGPADQPYLYEKPARNRFILGANKGVNGMHRPDLQRTPDGTALIGDKRNDENKIVAQMQALFLLFHNRIFDIVSQRNAGGRLSDAFLESQRIVRWCYQWIVLHDFLPKVCDREVVEDVMPSRHGRAPNLQFYVPHDGAAYLPVEFSVAAYRFGHSMVRPSYSLNDVTIHGTGTFPFNGVQKPFARIPVFVGRATQSTDAMNGFGDALPALPDNWGIDWRFFFGEVGRAPEGQRQIPQPAYRIDASLVDPLGDLPEFAGAGSPFASLAFRNLQRGVSMGLPSGQNVARMMGARTLTDDQLWTVKNEGETLVDWPEGAAFFNASRKWLDGTAPLWYYILKEAEVLHHGHHLGAVGSRIVAEVLVGLAWFDHFSYLFQMPRWTPAEERLGLTASLDMLELTRFVG